MRHLAERLAELAQRERCSAVVRVDQGDQTVVDLAFGLADRAHGVAVTTATVFAAASVTKGFTALVVMRMVEAGLLTLDTTARQLLGDDLPLIADDVTVKHLLAHRSGIGDYYDEDVIDGVDAYVLSVPPHQLDCTEAYLAVLDGYPTKFPAGERFAYCNGGFVVLALIAERAAGRPYTELVEDLVCRPAGMTRTSFLRSDTAPGDVARCYMAADGLRTNVLHMPLLGGGDGGVHTTTDDIHALWRALMAGRVVRPETFALMTAPHSEGLENRARYGLGFWLGADHDTVALEGYDAGISARTVHRASTGTTCTVLANTSEGAWPLLRLLRDDLHL
jgi:CubicO group peptidase (beta-lactamase class C family)